MKRIVTNILAALAILAGLVIGALGKGLLAVILGIGLVWTGAVTIINRDTDWIWYE